MKKATSFNEVDVNVRCIDCNRPLKKNLLARKPDAKRCYVCNTLRSGNQNINRDKLKKRQEQYKLSYFGS
jgi:hypothetical protein